MQKGEWSETRDLPGTILSLWDLGPRASYFWLCDLGVPVTPLTLAKSPFIQEMLTLEQNTDEKMRALAIASLYPGLLHAETSEALWGRWIKEGFLGRGRGQPA